MALEPASSAGHSARLQVRSVRAHVIIASLSAVMLLLAFPQPGWGWLAHVALVPVVLLALRSAQPRMLAGTLYAVNAVWWVFMLRWLMPVTGFGAVLLGLYMAVYLPITLLMVRFLSQRYRCAMVLLLPLVWTSTEFVRGIFLSGGFGWYSLGYTQAPFDPSHGAGRIMQIADIFGEFGVTFLVVMTNGWIVDLLSKPWVRIDGTGRRRRSRTVLASTLLWALSIGFAFGYGQYRISQTPSEGPSLVVAVIQTDVPQDNKDRATYEQAIEDWTKLLSLTAEASQSDPKPDLIVWSETVVPASLNIDAVERAYDDAEYWRTRDGDALSSLPNKDVYEKIARDLKVSLDELPARLAQYAALRSEARGHIQRLAQAIDTPIIVGAPTTIDGGSGGRFNSSYLALASGQFTAQRYDKMLRVPFGEYMPWVENIGWLNRLFIKYLSPYDENYTLQAGAGPVVFDVPVRGDEQPDEASESDAAEGGATAKMQRVVRVVTPICFEDTIARVTRPMVYDQGVKRADLIANQTNDGWFANTNEPVQHLQMATFRSVELRVPTVRSVNRGVSGFIDSSGRITKVVEVQGKRERVEGHASAVVTLDARSTIFGRIGQWPVILASLATLGLLIGGVFKRAGGQRGMR